MRGRVLRNNLGLKILTSRVSVFSFQFSVFKFQFSIFSFQFSVFKFQFSVFDLQFSIGSNIKMSVVKVSAMPSVLKGLSQAFAINMGPSGSFPQGAADQRLWFV
jgi:hypothetical protein